jgi:hypothetical protein
VLGVHRCMGGTDVRLRACSCESPMAFSGPCNVSQTQRMHVAQLLLPMCCPHVPWVSLVPCLTGKSGAYHGALVHPTTARHSADSCLVIFDTSRVVFVGANFHRSQFGLLLYGLHV